MDSHRDTSTAAVPATTQRQRACGLAVGTIALLMIGLQPLLLGELVERQRITLEGVGIVAMGEIVAVGLGVIAGDAWLSPTRLRAVALWAALVTLACDLATAAVHGDAGFTAVRVAAGLGEGLMVWVATGVIVRSPLPDRLAGIFLAVQTLGQALVAMLLAVWVVPRFGWAGGFAVLAVLTALSMLPAAGLPQGVAPLGEAQGGRRRWRAAHALALAVPLLQLAAIGSVWAYLEPLGRVAGLDAQAAQSLVSGVLVMQVLGGAAAAVMVQRLAAVPTLGIGAGALAAIALAVALAAGPAPLRFVALSAAFGFIWLFLMPFHIRLAFDADASGQVAVLVPAAQLIGSAFGPLVASLVVSGDDATPVPWVGAAFAVLSVVVVGLARAGALRPAQS